MACEFSEFGDQCSAAGKVVVDLLLRSLAGIGYSAFQVADEFVHFGELVAKLDSRFPADPGCMSCRLLELARRHGRAGAQCLVDRSTAFLAKLARQRCHRLGAGLADG